MWDATTEIVLDAPLRLLPGQVLYVYHITPWSTNELKLQPIPAARPGLFFEGCFCMLFIQRGREKSAKGTYPEIISSSKH
jgi:hypothetical protein